MDPTDRDDHDLRAERASVWTDVSVHSLNAPRTAPDYSNDATMQTPFERNRLEDDEVSELSAGEDEHKFNAAPTSPYPYGVAPPVLSPLISRTRTMRTENPVLTPNPPQRSYMANPNSPAISFPESGTTLVETDERRRLQGHYGGQRSDVYYHRGVLTRAGNERHQNHWPRALSAIIGLPLRNVALYEEALESPESGVSFTTHLDIETNIPRKTDEGNKQLARVGEQAMRLVLTDLCYTLQMDSS